MNDDRRRFHRTRSRTRGRAVRAVLLCLLGFLGSALPAAPAAAATVAVSEAEAGTLTGWNVRTFTDASAGNGAAVRLDSGGAVRLRVTTPADAGALTLRVRGDQCAGAPVFSLIVDSATVAEGAVSGTSWSDRTYEQPLVAGTHVIEIRYANDHAQYWTNPCNRNLYLDKVTLDAPASGALARNAPIPAGFVHQAGTQLLDGANRPVRLRGVNLGGWLMWEGWMWGQGFDYIGETAMMRNLSSLVGATQAEQFRADVRASFITASDFKAMSAYGIRSARVPINYKLLEDDAQPFTYKQSGWDVLDRTLSAAKQANVYVVLEMHAAPCSQSFAFVTDYTGPEFLWWSPKCQDRMVAMWKAIAARYANENVIAGYDLLGETVTTDSALLNQYKRVTAAIREVDRNHTLIYEGNNVAHSFDLFTAPLDSNQMLSFHDYPGAFFGQDLTARMPGYDAAAKRLNTPQWAGEFGQTTYEGLQHYIKTFEADPLVAGWAQWSWKHSPGLPSMQTIQHTAASKKLIEWINVTSRPRPTAAEAAQGMSDFVRAIRFENTVHDARLRGILQCGGSCTALEAPGATAATARSETPEATAAAPAALAESRASTAGVETAKVTSTPSVAGASTPTGTPLAPRGTASARLRASVDPSRLTAALRSGVRVAATVPGPGRLTAVAVRSGRVVARGAAKRSAGGRGTVTLAFTAKARRQLRHNRRAEMTVWVTFAPPRGVPVSDSARVTLAR